MSSNWIDSHNHLSDPRLDESREELIARAEKAGIGHFLQGGVGPEDWQRQKHLKQKHPNILLCFGLHPYWIADHAEEDCEQALNLLSQELASPQVLALGELGLDFRPHIMKESRERQIEYFELQMELAEVAQKPMVLHLVRAFEEAKKIFEIKGVPTKGGMVHSFNGSVKEAQFYLSQGLHLSVGGPVVSADNQKLHQAVAEIPMEFLLIETDSPDQPPPDLKGQYNAPETLITVASQVAKIKKLEAREVLDRSAANLRKLLSL